MNFEKYDIITMGNGKKYTVSEILNHNDFKYFQLIEVDENEELLEEVKIVKLAKNNQNEFGLLEIEDQNELLEVQELILSMFEADYSEAN